MNSIISGLNLFQAAGGAGGSSLMTIGMFGAVIVIFYFFIIRPQNKKQKEMQKMLSAIKKGDKIVTIGGLHGIVHAVKDTTVVIKADDNAKLEFSKSAIATVKEKAEVVEAVEEPKVETGK
jgi:preprotein translocase subunit YajC